MDNLPFHLRTVRIEKRHAVSSAPAVLGLNEHSFRPCVALLAAPSASYPDTIDAKPESRCPG